MAAIISFYHHFFYVWAVLLTLLTSFSSSISFAHTHDMQIKSCKDTIIYVDDYEFTQTGGRLELNVSNINLSISDHSNNLNLSQMGFFISGTQNLSSKSVCPVGSSDVLKRVYTFDKLGLSGGSINKNHFEVVLSDFVPLDGGYYLFFVSCIPDEHAISLYVQYAMYNLLHDGTHRCYLSPSELLEQRSIVVFIYIYLMLCCLSLIYHLLSYKSRLILRIHKFMFLVLLLRVFSLICKWLNKYYIMSTGCSRCWASTVLIIISGLLSRVPQASLAILIVSGWSYIKTSLSYKDKMFLITAININIVLVISVALVDCFVRIKYPVQFSDEVTSIVCCFLVVRFAAQPALRYLRQAGFAEGKAADCLFKINLLRRFLISLYMFYVIAATPIMFWDMAEIFDRRKISMRSLVSKESMTLVFYALLGYQFRPSVLKLKVPVSDDIEKDAIKIHANPPEYSTRFDLFGDCVY